MSRLLILADSSAIVAMLVRQDASHGAVRAFMRENREPILLPTLAITEVSYFLAQRTTPRDEANFLRSVAGRRLRTEEPVPADYARAADLVEQYANFPLGTVDALIVAMAERLDVTTLFTLDRRHFGAIRPAHCQSFALVP